MPPEPASRRRMTKDARRSQLLDVALDLFVRDGFPQVTMEDIAQAAGVTRPIPYHHFDSREGVYIACVERERDRFQTRMVAAVLAETQGVERLRRGAEVFFDLLDDAPGRWRMIFGGGAVLGGERACILEDLRFATIDVIELLLREAFVPQVADEIVTASAHAVSGVGERLGHWKLRRPELTQRELVEHFLTFVVAGVGPYLKPA